MRNFEIHNAILPPGVIRCNAANPCTGMVFDNVQADGWWSKLRMNYFVENTHGEVINSKPAPAFVTPEGDGFVGDDDQYEWVQRIVHSITGIFSGKLARGQAVKAAIDSMDQVYGFMTTY